MGGHSPWSKRLQLNKDGAAGKGSASSGAGEEASCNSGSLEKRGGGLSWGVGVREQQLLVLQGQPRVA